MRRVMTETETEKCMALTILPRNMGRKCAGASRRRPMASRCMVRRERFLQTSSDPLAAAARAAEHGINRHLHHAPQARKRSGTPTPGLTLIPGAGRRKGDVTTALLLRDAMLLKDDEMLWKDFLPQDVRLHLHDVRLPLMMHITGSTLEKREEGGLAPPRPSTEEGTGIKTDETGVLGLLVLLRMQHHAARTALKMGVMATGETCKRNQT